MRVLSRSTVLGLALVALTGIAGCATPPPASDPDALAEFNETNDPIEPTNRVFYAINDGLDTVILRPLAKAYRYVVPEVIRTGAHNALANLSSPVLLANDIIETKPRRAGDTLMRLLINSTVGVAGVFDVATDWGYPEHEADFGMTLALWGIPDGPFLFLPVLGPSNPRDAAGFGVDILFDPLTWAGSGTVIVALNNARYGVSGVDARAAVLDDVDKIKEQALDPYATFRSLARQHRASQIDNNRADSRATIPAWFPQPAQPATSTP